MNMEECINAVKENFPEANGITMDQPCDPIGKFKISPLMSLAWKSAGLYVSSPRDSSTKDTVLVRKVQKNFENGQFMHWTRYLFLLPIEGCNCYAEYNLESIVTYQSCKFEDDDGNSF